jgi:hypothetical protein
MTKKFSTLALIFSLASAMAFAGDTAKSTSTGDDAKTNAAQPAAAAASDNASQDSNNPCSDAKGNKNKDKAKPAPTNQEKEFDKVLQGIYG